MLIGKNRLIGSTFQIATAVVQRINYIGNDELGGDCIWVANAFFKPTTTP